MTEVVIYRQLQDEVCELVLNRPSKINTLNAEMISALLSKLEQVSMQQDLRVVILKGSGNWFCGGADLKWMAAASELDEEENSNDAMQLARLFQTLNKLPIATIANVHGGAMGGGIGLLCCCDIVIASDNCEFSFAELKLGLLPATIMPYVLATIGNRQARRFMLSAERFLCQTAKNIGLVHQMVSRQQLENTVSKQVENILMTAPRTFQLCKATIQKSIPDYESDLESLSQQLAKSRCSTEAKQGIQAFLDKTQPSWVRPFKGKIDKET